MIWIVLALMTAVALSILLPPLLRGAKRGPVRAEHDIQVYRQQLAEVERDEERGLIGSDEGKAARLEIERRLLRADADLQAEGAAPDKSPASRHGGWLAAAVVSIGIPVAAASLYLELGSPDIPDEPFAGRRAQEQAAKVEADTARKDAEKRVADLQQKLKASPGDANDWIALGQTLRGLDRNADAADAFARAIALGRDSPGLLSVQGETLVLAADGVVTPAARRAFERALAKEPREPRARFYIGLAALQAGKPREALRIWTRLAAESKSNAPWLPMLRRRIRETADANNINPDTLRDTGESSGPGPSQTDIEAAKKMSPEQRQAMIHAMIDKLAARLAENPDDLEGWKRLAHSYDVLGEKKKAVTAWSKAAALAPKNVPVLIDYGKALLAARGGKAPDQTLDPTFVDVMKRIIRLDDDNAVALWYLGLAELQAGNKGPAREYWNRLLAVMPKDSPERETLKHRMEQLL